MAENKIIQFTTQKIENLISYIPFLARLYSSPYQKVVKKEIELGDITHKDRILNVGCGAVPFTAIHIVKYTGAEVIAIDHDSNAVQKARTLLAKTGYDKKIKVQLKSGEENLNTDDFSAAVVALQASPKTEILNNLLQYGGKGVRIIFRKASPNFSGQYDGLPENPRPDKQVQQSMKTFDTSVLYTSAAL